MKFEVLNDEQLLAEKEKINAAFVDGKYFGTIITAIEKMSKKGNLMFELEINVHFTPEYGMKIKTWIMHNQPWAIKALCASMQRIDIYESGEINTYELLNKQVYLDIAKAPRTYTNKEGVTQTKEFFEIKEFLVPPTGTVSQNSTSPEFNDDIPF